MRMILLVYSDNDCKLTARLRDLHPEENDSVAVAWGEDIASRYWPEGAVRAELLELVAPFAIELDGRGHIEICAKGNYRKITEFGRAATPPTV